MQDDLDAEWAGLPEGRIHFGWANAMANLEDTDAVICYEDAAFRDAC